MPYCPRHMVNSILISWLKLFERIKTVMSMMPLVAIVVFIYAVMPLCDVVLLCAVVVFIDTQLEMITANHRVKSLRKLGPRRTNWQYTKRVCRRFAECHFTECHFAEYQFSDFQFAYSLSFHQMSICRMGQLETKGNWCNHMAK